MGLAPADANTGPATPLRVYPPGLDKAAGLVEDGNGLGLKPDISRLYAVYQVGTPIGAATLSQVLVEACQTHHTCLTRTSAALASYVAASAALVAAIRTVQANYSEADMASEANSAAVAKIISDAMVRVTGQQATQATAEARNAADARAAGSEYTSMPYQATES